MRKRRITAVPLIIMFMATAACIHKTGGTVTPMERVTTDNAVFAQINNTIEQGTEAVQKSGLISPAQAAPVISWTGQVATAHLQITAILAKGSTVSTADYSTIQALLDQIEQSGTALVNTGALGIKNPNSQNTISQDIQSAVNLAKAILVEVQAFTPTGGA